MHVQCDISCTRVDGTFLFYNNKEEAVFLPPSCAVGVKAAVFIPLHQRLLLCQTQPSLQRYLRSPFASVPRSTVCALGGRRAGSGAAREFLRQVAAV